MLHTDLCTFLTRRKFLGNFCIFQADDKAVADAEPAATSTGAAAEEPKVRVPVCRFFVVLLHVGGVLRCYTVFKCLAALFGCCLETSRRFCREAVFCCFCLWRWRAFVCALKLPYCSKV